MTRSPALQGFVGAGYEAVRDAFAENFALHNELGGAVCVVVDGAVVADLWGGWRDLAQATTWDRETLVDVFSVGKGVLATAIARLVGRGVLDLDAPLSATWPEFGAAGKERVTLRHVLSHTAGLPAVRRRLPPGSMLDPSAMREALAAERPWWEPGTAHGYHVNTFGFLVGAVIERATGKSAGAYLRDEVCGPIGADVHVGLSGADLDRVAEFRWDFPAPPETEPDDLEGLVLMRYNTYWNPSGLSGAGVVNTEAWRRAEHPSTNTHATARGVARLYDALVRGGTVDGYDLVDPGALAEATSEASVGDDLVLERPSRFGLGFQLPLPDRPIGRSPRGFGHFGAGGSLGFCDPDARLAFGYVTSDMGPRWQNPRNRGLAEAVYASIG
ncbi:MAG TPA: serine hydrolase domain-containing protein [Acidimicrobiales bacterium]|jgi:CubicO group peptidase (beta-lactamase class C family)